MIDANYANSENVCLIVYLLVILELLSNRYIFGGYVWMLINRMFA